LSVTIPPSQPELPLDTIDRALSLEPVETEDFERILRLTKSCLTVPLAVIILNDEHKKLYSSMPKIAQEFITWHQTFNNISVGGTDANTPFIIEDTLADPKFAKLLVLVPTSSIRFYAAVPLQFKNGDNIGHLCIADNQPRTLSLDQIQSFTDLALTVSGLFISDECKHNQ